VASFFGGGLHARGAAAQQSQAELCERGRKSHVLAFIAKACRENLAHASVVNAAVSGDSTI